MDLSDKKLVKKICEENNIWPSKHSGQNFLIDKGVLFEIFEIANLNEKDNVLEIGPGLGVLTNELLITSKQVVAIELDEKLANNLKNLFFNIDNIKLINSDILSISNDEILDLFEDQTNSYKLVSNLPYNITSVVLKKFLSFDPKPKEIVVMLQKEVGERICAKVGDMSVLAVSVQLFADPSIMLQVWSKSFWPEPEVDSVVLKIENIKSNKSVEEKYEIVLKKFFQVVKIGFSSKRKKLQNNLSAGYQITKEDAQKLLNESNLDLKLRAQDLTIDNWVSLTKVVDKKGL